MSEKIIWTDEIKDAFEILMGREENLTFVEIARRMSDAFGLEFTKNACVGHAHRMRLPPRPVRKKVPSNKSLKSKGKMVMLRVRVDAPILPREAQRSPDSHDLTIYQLREGDCRYPSNETKPPYTYCGQATEFGLSYCPHHCEIVYNAPKPR